MFVLMRVNVNVCGVAPVTRWFIKNYIISIGLNTDVWLKVEINVLLNEK